MSEPASPYENIAGALLAAGAAKRFGADKLLYRIDGAEILKRAAQALKSTGISQRAAIVRPSAAAHIEILQAEGFEIIENEDAERGMGTSLAMAARWASATGADGLLVALADMPFAETGHFLQLARRFRSNGADIAFSVRDDARTPPAIFGQSHFSRLTSLQGDEGARGILRTAPSEWGVAGAAAMLADIDRPSDCAETEFP